MKPSTFEEWKHCITVACGIPLTIDYVEQRLIALRDTNSYHTQKLRKTWGDEHYAKVTGWFEKARVEL